MRMRVDWSAAESQPSPPAVLRSQRLPAPPSTPPRIAALLQEAMESYLRLAEPRAVFQVVDQPTFARIHCGEGRNLSEAPLDRIVPRAAALALFVATAGGALSEAISRMFSGGDPARAYMLDAVASEAADGLAVAVGAALVSALRRAGAIAAPTSVLPYSPGYCGWDLTGQRALFDSIAPQDLGITLNASYLMQPLKSVSGVLVVGPPDVHAFRPEFACCDACRTRLCRHRIATLHLQ